EPAAGRGDPQRPTARGAHRDASERTRSAIGLDRAAQAARNLSLRPANIAKAPPPPRLAATLATGLRFSEGGLHQCPEENNAEYPLVRREPVSSLVAIPSKTAASAALFACRHGRHCRDRLAAGGTRIQTVGTASQKPGISESFRASRATTR